MSVLINASGKYLDGTLTTGLDRTKYLLISNYVYMNVSTSAVITVGLEADSGFVLQARVASGMVIQAYQDTPGASPASRNGSTTFSTGAWVHQITAYEPDSVNKDHTVFYGGVSEGIYTTGRDFTGNTSDYTGIRIGQGHPNASADSKNVAEVSVWECDSDTTLATLAAALNGVIPSTVSVSGATMRGYWPCETDGDFDTVGVNLSNVGSCTFDAGTHPSLSGGGGGGSTAQVIACII